MNFYKHYIGDFQRDTNHLSLTERGAYLALMHHYYATETPLPVELDQLCRIAGAITSAERKAVKVAMGFFDPTDSGLTHDRIEAELEKAGQRSNTNREIALAREAKRRAEREAREKHETCTKRAQDVPRTDHEQSTNQTPDTREEQESKTLERQAARLSDRFPEFWDEYPNKKGKADALKAWKRKGLDKIADEIIADVKDRIARDREWLDGYVPHGSTYVNGSRWEDDIVPPRDNSGGADGRDDFMARAV